MNEFSAVIGLAQLKKLANKLKEKKQLLLKKKIKFAKMKLTYSKVIGMKYQNQEINFIVQPAPNHANMRL